MKREKKSVGAEFLWPDIDILWPDINILRPDIDVLRPDIDILWPDIDILWPYIYIHSAQCVHWTVGFPCSKNSPVLATGEFLNPHC